MKFRREANAIGEELGEMAVTAEAMARDQLAPISSYVREAPIKSIMMAAGIGAIVGLILFRR